ncbi:MAG: O-antigen ligase family protein [Pseudomonadota bacterium]
MPYDPAPPSPLERPLLVALPLLFAAAVLPFAAVHPGWRLAVAALAIAVGGVAAWVGLHARSLPWTATLVALLGLGALAFVAAGLLPLGPAGRASLQPGLVGPLSILGEAVHPLAVDPARALNGAAFASGVLLLALGTAALTRSLERARGVAWVLVLTGVGTVGLAGLHRATAASSIYWSSGVPTYARDPFFAPFVSGNHGGAACAALLPLALALMLRQDMARRLVALGCTAVLLFGVGTSGSRGAALEAGVAVVTFGLLLGSRTVLALTGLAIAGGLGVLWQLGPRTVALQLSSWVSPDGFEGDLLLGRGGIWASTVDLIRGAPWGGVGTGGYLDAYQAVKSMPVFTTTAHAHQDYLQALAEQGIVGGGLWIALAVLPFVLGIIGCLRQHRGRRRSLLAGFSAAAAALLTSACFDFPAHIGALAVLMSLVGGVLVIRSGSRLPALGGPRAARVAPFGAALLALVSLGLVAFTVVTSRDPESRWAPAALAEAQGDDPALSRESAHRWYTQALARRPLDPETLFKLARVAAQDGNPEAARAYLVQATEAYPTLLWPWLHLARFQRSRGDPVAARAAYAHLLALDMPSGQSAAPYIEEALLTDEDPRVVLEAVLPERADRLREAAGVMARHGIDTYAEELYFRALVIEPRGTVAYASFLFLRHHYHEALVLLEDQREGCFANRTAGDTLLALRRYQDALGRYQAGQRDCGSDDLAIRAGIAQARLGLGERAGLDVLEQLVAENPAAWGLRRALIGALIRWGRWEQVPVHLQALVDAGQANEREVAQLLRLRQGRMPAPASELAP